MDRKVLGQQKVGMPLMSCIDLVMSELNEQGWDDLQLEPISYYLERMSMSHLPSLLDSALSDEALSTLNPLEVQTLALVMLRDHFRHNADVIRPNTKDATWVEPVFDKAFQTLSIPAQRTDAFAERFDLDDMKADWASALAKPFGISAPKLFMTHASIATGFKDEAG